MNNTTAAFKAAQRILDEIKEETGLTFETYDDVENILEDLRYNYSIEKVYFEWGASRVVFYDDESDYVIKIARDECFEKYNELEVTIYADAEARGFGQSFGWCECYMEPKNGRPGIYVMEFLDGDSSEVDHYAYNYGFQSFCNEYHLDTSKEESMERYSYERPDDEEELMDYFMSFINPDLYNAFNTFYADWGINDIHSGNILFRNGRPVICDYAGWGW